LIKELTRLRDRSRNIVAALSRVSNLRDEEDIVLERLLVHAELASLAKPRVAADVVA